MKHYKSSNGAYLTLVQGEGLGDGIPRGQLTLVTEENIHMFLNPFDTATVTVVKHSKTNTILLRIRMVAHDSMTVEDLTTWLGSEFKTNVKNPLLIMPRENSNVVTFVFGLTNKQAAKLGYRGQDGECVILKRAG